MGEWALQTTEEQPFVLHWDSEPTQRHQKDRQRGRKRRGDSLHSFLFVCTAAIREMKVSPDIPSLPLFKWHSKAFFPLWTYWGSPTCNWMQGLCTFVFSLLFVLLSLSLSLTHIHTPIQIRTASIISKFYWFFFFYYSPTQTLTSTNTGLCLSQTLFYSYLWHGTKPNHGSTDRICPQQNWSAVLSKVGSQWWN